MRLIRFLLLALLLPPVTGAAGGGVEPQPQPQPQPQPALDPQPVPDPRPGRAMHVGLNLTSVTDYGTQAPFVNAFNTFTHWRRLDRVKDPPLKTTPTGYPLEDASATSYLWGYPDGAYAFRMEGSGSVTVGGTKTAKAGFRREGNVVVGTVIIQQRRGGLVEIKLRNIDPANPPRNMRLIVPGRPVDTAEVFTPWFIEKLRPFRTLRLMDWGMTNGSNLKEWSDRRTPDHWTQSERPGVSYEYMADLVNALECDVWLCVPDQASDDFVTKMATLFRDRLHPRAVVWIEYSNELWNMGHGFPQSQRNAAAGKKNPELINRNSAAQNAAFHCKRVGDAWRGVFGRQQGRIRPVFGGMMAIPGWAKEGLEFLDRKYGPPEQYLYAISATAYVGLAHDVDRPGLTADAAFDRMMFTLGNAQLKGMRKHKAMADKYGLLYTSYEGGQHITAWNPKLKEVEKGKWKGGEANVELKAAMQKHPRMGELYRRLLEQEQAEGNVLFMHFGSFGKGSKFGHWGLAENIHETGPKLEAVLAFIRSADPAPLPRPPWASGDGPPPPPPGRGFDHGADSRPESGPADREAFERMQQLVNDILEDLQ